MAKTHGTCIYYIRRGVNEGQCCRFPPVPMVVGVMGTGPLIRAFYPPVMATEPACGELYEPKEPIDESTLRS